MKNPLSYGVCLILAAFLPMHVFAQTPQAAAQAALPTDHFSPQEIQIIRQSFRKAQQKSDNAAFFENLNDKDRYKLKTKTAEEKEAARAAYKKAQEDFLTLKKSSNPPSAQPAPAKMTKGAPVSADIQKQTLPPDIAGRMQKREADRQIAIIGHDVVLYDTSTNKVLDVVAGVVK